MRRQTLGEMYVSGMESSRANIVAAHLVLDFESENVRASESERRSMNSSRTGLISFLLLTALATTQWGCAIRCGPVQTVPPQKLHVMAATPTAYAIRVVTGDKEHIDTPVPTDGRLAFDVPVGSRLCTPYLFGVIKVGWPTPVEERRVIRVMRGERTVRKLSARDIARLPADAEGFHAVRIE